MKSLWTCAGENSGYALGTDVRTHNGYYVGMLHASEVYGPDGHYLGETTHDCYLITDPSKKGKHTKAFEAAAQGHQSPERVDRPRLVVDSGFMDSPSASHFMSQGWERKRAQTEELLRAWVVEDD